MITVTLLLYFLCVPFVRNDAKKITDEIEYYSRLIEEKIESSENYKLPTDASSYRPTENDYSTVYGHYDFIIVGAGSAGTVVANRLSENKNWKILLLEAGKFADELVEIPAVASLNLNSEYNWGYKSTPQTNACLDNPNQQCKITRGKGVGGSTLINGVLYARGNEKEFDFWADEGNSGWSYNTLLPLFKKLEHFHHNDKTAVVDRDYHGYEGELSVEFHEPKSIFTDTFNKANVEIGFRSVDYNGAHQIGSSHSQQCTKHGKRCHNGKAFIEPILKRKNFEVLPESYVTKVLINETTKTAYGVQFANNQTGYTVFARKEVILSGGIIGSAQILLLSGVGPVNHLQEMNISLIQGLDVGSSYLTHVALPNLVFNSNVSVFGQNLSSAIVDFLNGKGRLTIDSHIEALGFYRLSNEYVDDYPNLEIVLTPPSDYTLSQEEFFETNVSSSTFSFTIVCVHCYSKGSVRLKSSDPFDYPLIDPNLLSDGNGNDILTLYNGIQLVLKIVDTEAFKSINASLIKPNVTDCDNLQYLSKDYWYCIIRHRALDYLHQVATCAMGPNPDSGSVVDNHLRVHGIKNLRVADASVIPFTLACHTSAPTMVVGQNAADIIKIDHQVYF